MFVLVQLYTSDQWAAYRQLQRRVGLHHRTVNHSLHFVDPATGIHTQHAKSNWSSAKDKFKVMKGNSNPNFLLEYLQEFMWRRWYGDSHPNGCFKRLLQDNAEQYTLWIRNFKAESFSMYAFSCRILKFSIVFKPKNNKKIIQQANATAERVCWKWIHPFYNAVQDIHLIAITLS